jgi:hypothetical protein
MWLGAWARRSWGVPLEGRGAPHYGAMSASRGDGSLSLADDQLLIHGRELAANVIDQNVQSTEIVIT